MSREITGRNLISTNYEDSISFICKDICFTGATKTRWTLRTSKKGWQDLWPISTRCDPGVTRVWISPPDKTRRFYTIGKKTETHPKMEDVPERRGSNLIEKPLYILKRFFGLQRIFFAWTTLTAHCGRKRIYCQQIASEMKQATYVRKTWKKIVDLLGYVNLNPPIHPRRAEKMSFALLKYASRDVTCDKYVSECRYFFFYYSYIRFSVFAYCLFS